MQLKLYPGSLSDMEKILKYLNVNDINYYITVFLSDSFKYIIRLSC